MSTVSGLVHVLVEGASDVAAVRAAARVAGRDPEAVHLVAMGGATNARRHLTDLVPAGHTVLGLCDRNEAPYLLRALRHVGYAVRDVDALPRHGFWVCDRDLEEELREDRPFADQLRRFAGAGSGRKELLAGALTAALTFDELPPPLTGLVSAFPA